MENKQEEKLVLCGYCQKPIHINDFGGVHKVKGFFHAKCFENNVKNKLKNDKIQSIVQYR